MRIFNRKKFTLTVIIVIIINLAASGLWGLFALEIRKERIIVAGLSSQVKNSEKRNTELRYLNIALDEIESDRRKLNEVFTKEFDIITLIKKIEEVASLAGVTLEIKSVDMPAGDDLYPVFSMKTTGSFSDIFYNLLLLENISYQIAFNNFNVGEAGILKKGDLKIDLWEANFEFELLSFINEI